MNSDVTPLIYRPALEKAAAMRADPARYFTVCMAQRQAEGQGWPIPADDEVHVSVGADQRAQLAAIVEEYDRGR